VAIAIIGIRDIIMVLSILSNQSVNNAIEIIKGSSPKIPEAIIKAPLILLAMCCGICFGDTLFLVE